MLILETKQQIDQLFKIAEVHHLEHGCSAPPYEHGDRLFEITKKSQPKNILEIGTGMGYTAVLLALAAPESKIESLEKDPEHAFIAKDFIATQGLGEQIKITEVLAEDYLATLKVENYDLIFFDGYQIHYEFLPYYQRLLKSGGTLVLGNNHLQSKTSKHFFEELENGQNWQILEKFGDTTVAEKL